MSLSNNHFKKLNSMHTIANCKHFLRFLNAHSVLIVEILTMQLTEITLTEKLTNTLFQYDNTSSHHLSNLQR